METIKKRINVVINAMNGISLYGIENQRKMVSIADYLRETINMMESQLVPIGKNEEKKDDAQ